MEAGRHEDARPLLDKAVSLFDDKKEPAGRSFLKKALAAYADHSEAKAFMQGLKYGELSDPLFSRKGR